MKIKEQLDSIAADRILILDGAMGSMIGNFKLTEADFRGTAGSQGGRFASHPAQLSLCNELLCLTAPWVISGIHEAYLRAGADIIETCSFNSGSVSLADYGLGDLSYEISAAAAKLARKSADKFSTPEKPRFVAGSMGPTAKSASLSPDMDNPSKRNITWDELEAAYYDSARGLLDGGADLFIIETIFDTLNAKAAIAALLRLFAERDTDVPIILSATVGGAADRLLSSQTLDAFCVSTMHARPWAVGLNCSFGAERLKAPLASLAAHASCHVIAYPNAGMPNRLGEYDENPVLMARHIENYMKEGLVNIVGGCCGSTPAHISVIAAKAKNYPPRKIPAPEQKTRLSAWDTLSINSGSAGAAFTIIGERTNAAVNRKFLCLIKEKNYDAAVEIALDMIENGASIIDVCMDDPALDAIGAMTDFLYFAQQYPAFSRVPFMIDSSRWEVIEAGLKCVQGKALINSISLKEGEAEFLRRVRSAQMYGAALTVRLCDERGQAASYERKIEAARRSWDLLMKNGFPASDIVFDPNVPAAGKDEHNAYVPDFIRACAWIKEHCPSAQISGDISNLSFNFRDDNTFRKAMHAVFLKHAAEAGLSMAVVNPSDLIAYDKLDPRLRDAAEALIFNVDGKAAERDTAIRAEAELLPLKKARANRVPMVPYLRTIPKKTGIIELNNYPLERVIPYINWTVFLQTWEMGDSVYPLAYKKISSPDCQKTQKKVLEDGKKLLNRVKTEKLLALKGAAGIFPAASEGDDIILFDTAASKTARFSFLRNQEKKRPGLYNPCLADFIAPKENENPAETKPADWMGLFVLSAGFGLIETGLEFRKNKHEYEAILLATLANSLVEAFVEEVHLRVRKEWWAYAPDEDLGAEELFKNAYKGIRPAFGYAISPDHENMCLAFDILDVRRRCGIELSKSPMIIPAASICGMYLAHPGAYYFNTGPVGDDQIADWAKRMGITAGEARRRLSGA